MAISPRHRRSALGDLLAEKLRESTRRGTSAGAPKPRSRPRLSPGSGQKSRPRRHASRSEDEVQRVLKDVEVSFVEHRLKQSHLGRELLRVSDARTKAKFKEDFFRLGLHADQKAADRARRHHAEVCNASRYGEYGAAHFALKEAEAALYKSTQIHAAAVKVRERVEFELKALQQPIEEPR